MYKASMKDHSQIYILDPQLYSSALWARIAQIAKETCRLSLALGRNALNLYFLYYYEEQSI